MARVKRGNVARNHRKKILKLAKGFRAGLSKQFRQANEVVLHAQMYATKDRRLKKRDYRALWIARISGALTEMPITYSQFINATKKKNVALNRKMLSEIAIQHPATFEEIVKFVQA